MPTNSVAAAIKITIFPISIATFTGYFLAGIAAGRAPAEAMEYAAMASAISVSRHGAAPGIPNCDEVCLELARWRKNSENEKGEKKVR